MCVFVCFVSPWVIYECSGADQNNYFLGQATLYIKKAPEDYFSLRN